MLGQVAYFVSDSLMPVFLHEELTVTSLDGEVLLELTDVAWYANHLLSVDDGADVSMMAPYPNPVRRGEDVNWMLPRGWSWRPSPWMAGLSPGASEPDGRVTLSTADWESGMVSWSRSRRMGSRGGKPARVFVD